MNDVPLSERIHITLFGLRNAGKSSLINAIAGRTVAIVSDQPGTTTDPVSKAMELGDLGPVVLTDTAGLDDTGELGRMRVAQSLDRLDATDIALLATPLHRAPEPHEREALEGLIKKGRPVIVVGTFLDQGAHQAKQQWLESLEGSGPAAILTASGTTGQGIPELRAALASFKPSQGPDLTEDSPLEGLVEAGDLVVLVTPIDSAAPKGRIILPQVAVLRDALDRGCATMVVRETELEIAMQALSRKPRLVITDSQAFAQVAATLPPDQSLTSFSIVFARKKGELSRFRQGLACVEALAAARGHEPIRLLALEACTHNRTHEDIATIKIPALLTKRTGRPVDLTVVRELRDAPLEAAHDLAVICGGCMATRKKMQSQLDRLHAAGIPALNFGLFLAWAHGVFPRAILPFSTEVETGPSSLLAAR